MVSSKLPKSYKCKTCGTTHEFPLYVYAHWRSKFDHTCEKCGAAHSLMMGHATLRKKGKVKK